MKRKITRVRPDGSKEIEEIDDEAPALRKASQQPQDPKAAYLQKMRQGGGGPMPQGMPRNQNLAAQGQRGDTQLAHVNPWEAALLKSLGGAGTRNPKTGLRQFYTSGDVYEWYTKGLGREADQPGLDYWTNYGDTPDENATNVYDAFIGAATAGGDQHTGWSPPSTQDLSPYDWPTGTGDGGVVTDGSGVTDDSFFDFPLDIMPTSTGSSTSDESTSNTSYSGLPADWQQYLLQYLMPQLKSSITDMEGNIDKYTGEALGSYQQMMQDALRTNIPTAIGGLANRGILSSTEGNKILSDVYSNAATDASTKGYTTAMQAALLKASMPSVLSQIGELGKTSYGTSAGTTSSSSSSYQADPTAMYQIMADMIKAMM